MYIKSLALFVLLFLFNILMGQENNFNFFEQTYSNYFKLEPETIYTQLNKTKYLQTEELWFKSYIYNTKTHKPYLTTTNVYVSIYNDTGELIEKKLFFAKDGMTNGNLELSAYNPGLYYIKVSTNFMRNFKEKHYSLQQFEIIGKENANTTLVLDKKFDLQFLPEGGHLLSNATNTIGFKIIDEQGNGAIIDSASVFNKNGVIVNTFRSNNFGMGKFNMFIKNSEHYKVEAILNNGSILTAELPQPELYGIALSSNILHPTTLFLNISTNSETLPSLVNKTYYIIIHRDGLLKKVDINFIKNKLNYIIPIPKKELLSGINIITVLNTEMKPISERLIYNHSTNLIDNLELFQVIKGKDSTTITLKTNKEDSIQKNISISVLPQSTKAYTSKENIISRFLLKPYINGNIENPKYYFENYNHRKAADLDILLLTQGWSSYSWNDIFYKPRQVFYHFESGMQIKGKLNNINNRNIEEIVLYSNTSELLLSTEISNDNYFSFENIFLIEGTSLQFSQKSKNNKLSKPSVYINTYPNFLTDELDKLELSNSPYNYDNIAYNEEFSFDNTTVLDTVSLTKNKISKPRNIINRGSFNTNKINFKERYDSFSLVTDVIRDNGFDVINTGTEVQILSRRSTGFAGRTQPNIFVDNIPLQGSDLLDLTFLRLEQVDEIYISRIASAGLGNRGGNINIFTKKGIQNPEQKLNFSEYIVGFGFTVPDKYYSPYYNKSLYVTYSQYAALNWIPNVTLSDNGIFQFKIPNYTYENICLFIEGMSSNGSLISKVEILNIN